MKIGPFYVIRDTGIPMDLPPRARDELVSLRAQVERLHRERLQIGLTWRCHVCGDTRPDDRISVYSRTVRLGTVEMKENVRYCNDRPACVAGAPLIRWIKEDA